MFCPKCGARNEDNVYHCATCGSPVRSAPGYGGAPQANVPPANVPPYGAPPVVQGGVYPPAGMPKPGNWLIPSILVTVFCFTCWPLGVVAIVFAAQVDGKYHQGDYQGAQAAAGKAKLFTILTAILSVLCMGGMGLLQLLGVLASIQ